MKEKGGNKNKSALRNKPLIIAVGVVALLVVLTVLYLVLKGPLWFRKAQEKAEKKNFSEALSYIQKADGEKAGALEDYITLRLDINRNYPDLLNEFNIDMITSWAGTAQELKAHADSFSEPIKNDILSVSYKLGVICAFYDEYNNSVRSDVLDMMDIFGEINRLYSKDADGNNVSFTVAEENAKTARWETICERINGYMLRIPDGMDIYLLSYLISETRGECDDLRDAMNGILAKGYSENDTVRVSGSGQKIFPAVQNSSGDSVSVSDKIKYEQFMFRSICKALTENLSEYYSGM